MPRSIVLFETVTKSCFGVEPEVNFLVVTIFVVVACHIQLKPQQTCPIRLNLCQQNSRNITERLNSQHLIDKLPME